MEKRRLGRSDVKVSAMGMGCWAIGGPFYHDGSVVGYGQVDDAESIRAIHCALDMGVTFFDTSDAYGCGHSESILGQALAGRRDQVVIATKFGNVIDEAARQITGIDATPDYIRRACEASLRRLKTDYIDLYQFHVHDYDLDKAAEVRETLEQLVRDGKIRFYGWSTIYTDHARVFAEGPHCTAMQHGLNVIWGGDPGMLELCEELDLASINRGPLAMGILTGKFSPTWTFSQDDMRHKWGPDLLAQAIRMLNKVRDALTVDGRTLAQGALGWIWARSEHTIPIPGFKTVAQVEENVGALEFGPLDDEQMQQIDEILSSESAEGEE